MFQLRDPTKLNQSWHLSKPTDSHQFVIPKSILKDLKTHHVTGIEFLYRSYKKAKAGKLNGVVLNEEEHLNCPIQVSAFLNSLFSSGSEASLNVCVVCPDESVAVWHYHLTNHAGLKVNVYTCNNKNVLDHFSEQSGVAVVVPFNELKSADQVSDHDFYSIIIDDFDLVANKRIVKKLSGSFNIGITKRSFYEQPDQKLQWTMLNWANPDCVGKLKEFYEEDNVNFENFRDNYRQWWFRLTWMFCESFEKPKNEEITEYNKTIENWSDLHRLCRKEQPKRKRRVNKSNKTGSRKKAGRTNKKEEPDKQTSPSPSPPPQEMYENSDSDDTIIYSSREAPVASLPVDVRTEISGSGSGPGPGQSEEVSRNARGEGLFLSLLENKDLIDTEDPVHRRKRQLFCQIFEDARSDSSSEGVGIEDEVCSRGQNLDEMLEDVGDILRSPSKSGFSFSQLLDN